MEYEDIFCGLAKLAATNEISRTQRRLFCSEQSGAWEC